MNRILPGTAPTLAFRLSGTVGYLNNGEHTPLPHTVVSGLQKSARLIAYGQNAATLIVHFQDTGAQAFFRQPLYALFSDSLSPADFDAAAGIAALEDKLFEQASRPAQVALVEQFLLQRLQPRHDAMAQAAVHIIKETGGVLLVRQLASQLCTSNDALEKRFRKAVGATPKQYAAIVRMNALIRSRQPGRPFTQTALDGGFYDQAHFNKEFRAFTGQTPGDFFKAPSFW